MLKWGVIGTGRIAQKVIPLIHGTPNHCFVGVASRSTERSISFADTFKIKRAFDSYEEMIENPDIEAIYLTTPNSSHFEWTKKSLIGGKHVLCEKPLAMTFAEVTELKEIAQKQKKILMEGFMYRHHEQTLNILKLLHSGKFGKILVIHGGFHFHLTDTSNIRLQKSEGGGALRDIGCYLVNFITAAIAKVPQSITASGLVNDDGVDTQASIFLAYSEGQSASLSCSFSAPRRDSIEITCERAHIIIDRPFKPDLSKGVTLITAEETLQHHWPDPQNSFIKQFDNFYEAITYHREPNVSLDHSCLNQKIIDSVLLQITPKSKNAQTNLSI